MAEVTLTNVEKIYPGGVHAVQDLTLSIADGEFVVLVGPSGCGKSTVLRMLAGLEDITSGEIRIGRQRVNDMSPQERDVAMVFQNYALYPHKTVQANLEFPLRMLGVSREERQERVERVADQLGLTPLLKQRPRHLSGGQRQRVAMGRAMVRQPQVFLLDEPLSNLDAKLRVRIRTEIAQLQEELGVTTLYVTHDQVEAMTLGDHVAVLSEGRLQQVGPGAELYEHPANLFVAGFIGSPRMNFFNTRLQIDDEGASYVSLGDLRLRLPNETMEFDRLKDFDGQEVFAGLRPEAFSLAAEDSRSKALEGTVRAVEALGHETIVYVATPLDLYTPDDEATAAGDAGRGGRGGRGGRSIVARLFGHQNVPQPGETIRLHVAEGLLHVFDQNGASLRTVRSRPGTEQEQVGRNDP